MDLFPAAPEADPLKVTALPPEVLTAGAVDPDRPSPHQPQIDQAAAMAHDDIIDFLTEFRAVLACFGYESGPVAAERAVEHNWRFFAVGAARSLTVTIALAEAEHRDGLLGSPGVNFCLTVTDAAGRVVHSIVPYNHTSEVWVDARDLVAVDDRLSVIVGFPVDDVVHELVGYWG